MPLDGTNAKCAKCTKDCKQFKQVKVVLCPNYAKVISDANVTHGKTL